MKFSLEVELEESECCHDCPCLRREGGDRCIPGEFELEEEENGDILRPGCCPLKEIEE